MNKRIINTIEKYNLIAPNDTVLIALSGGADSIYLAKFLLSIKEEYNLTLKAAHIEHGIRGKESLDDCSFVENFCKENNIECHTLHFNAIEESKNAKVGVEEYSRNKRYEFFYSISCDKIATAHNLSDNVETVLFRLARGSSLKGMCGIPFKRDKIIRPILEISSEEIRNYLQENNIPYCVDFTNNENEYSRNKIRNNIIPLFKEINSDFENTVNRFIKIANEDEHFLDNSVNSIYKTVIFDNSLNLNKLREFSVSVIKRVLIKYFSENNISLDEYHINELLKLVFTQSKTQIKDNVFAISNANSLRIARFGNNVDFNSAVVKKEILTKKDFLTKCELSSKKFDFYCDCDKIIGNVLIRSRQAGDKITLSGRNCSKTLKKLYNELGIPVEDRGNIPVIVDDNGVIGIYGYCVDERVSLKENTKNVMILNIRTEDFI